jgi:predicted nucleotidyltransferase
MAAQLESALDAAALSDVERRTLQRLVSVLRSELGEDLHAVWLYGSRARGERPHAESDVDLMVIADGGESRYGFRAHKLAHEVAGAEGSSPAWYSVYVYDPEWLRGRREIRSFFIQEVDRDKIVLFGSGLD